MKHQPTRGSSQAPGGEHDWGTGPGAFVDQPGTGPAQGPDESWLADIDPRAPRRPGPTQPTQPAQPTQPYMAGAGAWPPQRQPPRPAWRGGRGPGPRGPREGSVTPLKRAGPPTAPNGAYPTEDGQEAPVRGQTLTISLPALRTFMTLAAVVVLSVVLSVIATLTVIAVMNAGVILPQYARLNQPTQVSQLGICVSKTGKITRPSNVGFCHDGTFVHVQPNISHP